MTTTRFRQWANEPLTTRPRVTVVIPTYNEAIRILPTIGAIAAYMCSRVEPWDLVVADDGSRDDTVRLLKDLKFPNLTVLQATSNGGKGSAVRRGVHAARGELILLADADQSTPIEQFDLLEDALASGQVAMAIGSRRAPDADVAHKSRLRHLFSDGLNLLVRSVLRIDVADTQCGFKLLRADVAHDVFRRQRLDGFAFDMELIYLCRRLGYPVAEVPIRWIDAPGSTVDPIRVTAGFLRDMATILANARAGYYDGPAIVMTTPAVAQTSGETAALDERATSAVPLPRTAIDASPATPMVEKESAQWT